MSGASDPPTGGNDSAPQITASPNAATNTAPVLHKKYSSFEPANQQQIGVYQTIVGILNDDKRGPDVLSDFQDELPPTVLLHQNVQSSTRLIKLVRDSIVETTSIQVNGRPRIIEWLLQTLYGDYPALLDTASRLMSAYERSAFPEERGERIVVVTNPQSGMGANAASPASAIENSASTFVNNDRESMAKRATSVAQRFTEERKYDGSPSSDLAAVIARYNDCKADYNLTEMEMRKFAHNLFSGDAKRYYDSDITVQSARTVEGVLNAVTSHFIHASQRNAVTSELRAQSIAKEVANGADAKEALTTIYRRIEKLNPMCSPECVGDRHKGTFLRRAVLSEQWSSDACAQYTANQGMSFATLYQLLTAAIVQQREIDEAKQQAMQHIHDTSYTDEVLYGGRLRNNSFRQNIPVRGRGRRPFRYDRPKDRGSVRCFKCSKMGHFASECPTKNDTSMIDAVRARVKQIGGDSRAVAETLYELATCSDLQEEFESLDSTANGVFESLFDEHAIVMDDEPHNTAEGAKSLPNFE
jgi:DNA-binding FrmR family transcriptional regulator